MIHLHVVQYYLEKNLEARERELEREAEIEDKSPKAKAKSKMSKVTIGFPLLDHSKLIARNIHLGSFNVLPD